MVHTSAAAAVAAAAVVETTNAHTDTFMDGVRKDFVMHLDEMRTLIAQFRREMVSGLAEPLERSTSELKQIPSYVCSLPTGRETGTYYALDLGGTNFRLTAMELRGDGSIVQGKSGHFVIPATAMTGSHDDLFGFIATSVGCYLDENPPTSGAYSAERPAKIGFTFSFPVQQTSLSSGSLIKWTKGFTTTGVVGQDVVALLQHALLANNVHARVVALVNDTVATLMAEAYTDPSTLIGIILGTGMNACYVENVSRIPKWTEAPPAGGKMIINMECGNFDSAKRSGLKHTKYDDEVDRASKNPGAQSLEKMCSGMYLGELARLVIVDLLQGGALFGASALPLFPRGSVETRMLSQVAADRNVDGQYSVARSILEGELKVPTTTLQDRKAFCEICELVASRAAVLSACVIVAIMEHTDRIGSKVCVAIDGSLFEHYPRFESILRNALERLIGTTDASLVRIPLVKDGSSKGSAVIAAVADSA